MLFQSETSTESFEQKEVSIEKTEVRENLEKVAAEVGKHKTETEKQPETEAVAEEDMEADKKTVSKPEAEQQIEQPITPEMEKQLETLYQFALKNPQRAVELARDLAKTNPYILDRFHDTLVHKLEQKDI